MKFLLACLTVCLLIIDGMLICKLLIIVDHRHVMVPVNNINTFLTRTQRILIENSWKRAKKVGDI